MSSHTNALTHTLPVPTQGFGGFGRAPPTLTPVLVPHSAFAPRGGPLPSFPRSGPDRASGVQHPRRGLSPPRSRMWGGPRLTRCSLIPRALPRAPDSVSRCQDYSPRGLPTSIAGTVRETEEGQRTGGSAPDFPGRDAPLQFSLSRPFPPPLAGSRLKRVLARSRLGRDAHSRSQPPASVYIC